MNQRTTGENRSDLHRRSLDAQQMVNGLSANLTAVSSEHSFADRIIDAVVDVKQLDERIDDFLPAPSSLPDR